MGRIGFSPFYRVLKESLHFWERRDNSDIQSFYLVFSIWILPESGREERKINKFLFILIIISHLSNTCQEKSKQQSVLSQDFSELIVFFTSYCDTPQCRRSIVMFVIWISLSSSLSQVICFVLIKSFQPPKCSNCLNSSSPLPLPFQCRVVEMQQRCAVFAPVEAHTDFLCRILIQCSLYHFQCRHYFLTQWCACGKMKSTARRCFTVNVVTLF